MRCFVFLSKIGIAVTILSVPNVDDGQADVSDYIALLKPRVMSLVVFTALVGMVLAPQPVHPVLGFISLLCIAIGAGASGALNMWWDADIDAVMTRTQKRPIPAGRMLPREAMGFGVVLSTGSVLILGLVANWFAASLLAFTIFFYVVIYTMWLKRLTPQNIVIGGAAGAFPPMVGWAAVTGGVSMESLVLFLMIFFWTPPHFWALALLKSDDYAKAGIPMLPVVAGPIETRKHILLYALVMAVIGVLPWFMGFAGIVYGVSSAALGVWFVMLGCQLFRRREGEVAKRAAGKMFAFSLFYLFALFAILLGEHIVRAFGA
jgi:protoheme IX farnesyltransferase